MAANQVRAMLRVLGIPDILDPAGERPTTIVADSCGFDEVETFSILLSKDIPTIIRAHNSGQGGQDYQLPGVMAKKLQALVYYCRDRRSRGQAIDAAAIAAWTPAHMRQCIDIVNRNEAKVDETPAAMSPGPIQTGIRWTGWWSQLETYLGTKIGYAGCPLLYVIRPVVDPLDWEPADEFERQIHETRHDGPDYAADNRAVYGEIKSFCKDTDAWVWIREFERTHNGRGAAMALRSHYEGDGERNKRRIWGAKQLEEAHYKSEHVYSFEKFSTKMKDAYKTLNDHGENHSESEMVRILLERMQVANNGAIDAVKKTCSRDFFVDFMGAVNYMSGEIT